MGIELTSETWDRIGHPGFPSLHTKKMIAYAAKSNRKSMQRLLRSILAPGTIVIPTSMQVPRSRGEAGPSVKCVRTIFDLGPAPIKIRKQSLQQHLLLKLRA